MCPQLPGAFWSGGSSSACLGTVNINARSLHNATEIDERSHKGSASKENVRGYGRRSNDERYSLPPPQPAAVSTPLRAVLCAGPMAALRPVSRALRT